MARFWVMSGEDMRGYATLHEAMKALEEELAMRSVLLELGLIDKYPVRLAIQNN